MLNLGQAPAYNLDISYEAKQAAKNGKLLTLPLETINPEVLEKARLEAEINRINRVNAVLVLSWVAVGAICFMALVAHYLSPWWLVSIPLAIAVRWIREKLKGIRRM